MNINKNVKDIVNQLWSIKTLKFYAMYSKFHSKYICYYFSALSFLNNFILVASVIIIWFNPTPIVKIIGMIIFTINMFIYIIITKNYYNFYHSLNKKYTDYYNNLNNFDDSIINIYEKVYLNYQFQYIKNEEKHKHQRRYSFIEKYALHSTLQKLSNLNINLEKVFSDILK